MRVKVDVLIVKGLIASLNVADKALPTGTLMALLAGTVELTVGGVVFPGSPLAASKQELLAFLNGKIANWWMPDDVAFVKEIPHTATGKILKTALRAQFKDYVLPSAAAVG